jgi:hypothetical protein
VKKSFLKNIITVLVLTTFFVSGISGTSVFCISECCSSENSCCEQSEKSESITKTSCCEFTQSTQNEKEAVTTFIKTNVLPAVKNLNHHSYLETSKDIFTIPVYSAVPIQAKQSKTILRI